LNFTETQRNNFAGYRMTLNLLQNLLRYFLHRFSVSVPLFGMLLFFIGSFFSLGYSPQALAESKLENPKAPHSSDETLRIVTTVEPYRLIAKAALNEITPESRPLVEITTLITQPISAHHFSLKPSQRIALKHANVVIVSRLANEPMLEKSLAKENIAIIDVSTLNNLIRYPARNNHTHSLNAQSNAHSKENDRQTISIEDTHYWFEPHNAELIGTHLLDLLQTKYPEKKSALSQARTQFQQKMTQQKKQWQHQLASLQEQRFLMFHDAYQYLEKWIGLKNIYWLTETDAHFIAPQKWIQVEKIIQNKGIDCIISSSEANEIFQKLQHKYNSTHKHKVPAVKGITLDDIARDYQYDLTDTPTPSPDHTYFDWIDWLVDTLLQCAPAQA